MNKNELMYRKIYNESIKPQKEKLDEWNVRTSLEKDKKEREQQAIFTEKKEREKEQANKMLFRQVQDKLQQKMESKRQGVQQEQSIKKYIEKEYMEKVNLERVRQDAEALRKSEYLETLRRQMEENSRRKAEPYLMSEKERKMNMKDLDAYENGVPVVHSKFPGMPAGTGFLKLIRTGSNSPVKETRTPVQESLLRNAGALAISPLATADQRTAMGSRPMDSRKGEEPGTMQLNNYSSAH